MFACTHPSLTVTIDPQTGACDLMGAWLFWEGSGEKDCVNLLRARIPKRTGKRVGKVKLPSKQPSCKNHVTNNPAQKQLPNTRTGTSTNITNFSMIRGTGSRLREKRSCADTLLTSESAPESAVQKTSTVKLNRPHSTKSKPKLLKTVHEVQNDEKRKKNNKIQKLCAAGR